MPLSRNNRRLAAAAAVLVPVAAAGAVTADYVDESHELQTRAALVTGGDPTAGQAKFIAYGCGSCHSLKNVRHAVGMVGPRLDGVALRAMIAGKLANNPGNLQHWIRDPQAVSPGTAMPDLNVGERDARDIAAFLYTRS
ncbi:c-type cytochrome [Sphingomonas sp. BN140010]|uniref:C-type cytochrome n=1 Tax=Sphingomonas arvum TaxID=2992113 RepID=A0ABT3JH83_9SPHN|nr:c-type cytochrome [Sphingomonas sp. BN140010]MCW3798443.1 c-type cytochrome [Sphingomonas sp. BN140010]